MTFGDSLRGYAFEVHKRDGFKCRYCGLDGSSSFDNWIRLSLDHLLPKEHSERSNPQFMVTACMFCNTADNHFFHHAAKRGLKFDGMTPEQLVEQRKPYVQKVRRDYNEFYRKSVSVSSIQGEGQ